MNCAVTYYINVLSLLVVFLNLFYFFHYVFTLFFVLYNLLFTSLDEFFSGVLQILNSALLLLNNNFFLPVGKPTNSACSGSTCPGGGLMSRGRANVWIPLYRRRRYCNVRHPSLSVCMYVCVSAEP